MRGYLSALLVFLIVFMAFEGSAWAERSYHGGLTTVLEGYENVEGETAMPFYQYLNLMVNDAIKVGGGSYFYFYGRYATDLKGEEDNIDSRLYSAYLNFSDVFKGADLMVGRQSLGTTAGSAINDGVELRVKKIGGWANVRLFAGGDAKLEGDYDRGDWLFGGTIDLTNLKHAQAGLSFLQRYDAWDVARRSIGLNADYKAGKTGRLYTEARYDMLSETVDTFLLGGSLYASKNLLASVEYYYNVPVFDSTDIYSVFAADEYREAAIKADYRVNQWLGLFGSYSHEFEDDVDDSDVLEVGANVRGYNNMNVYASALYRAGEDEMVGGKLNARVMLSDSLAVGGGIQSDSYKKQGMSDTDSASRYFVDTRMNIAKNAYIYGKVEGLKSTANDNEIRARIKFSYAF